MFMCLIIIVVTNIVFEVLLEKLNQSKQEPFEKLQAKIRYIRKKKVWYYATLLIVLVIGNTLANTLNIGLVATGVLLGVLVALTNTIFENTMFDSMRNTLR